MTYQQYTAEWNGKQVTRYGGECVAGVAEFEAENNLPIVYGDAHQWINNPLLLNHYDWVANNPNDPNQLPPQGAIIIWPLPNEHIAFFDHNIDHLTFMTFGQNSGGRTMHFQVNHWAHVAGWYVPKGEAQPAPQPAPAPAPAPTPAPHADFTPLNETVTVISDTLVVRSGPGTNYAGGQANSTDGNLHKDTQVQISGYTHGEAVIGNDIWLRSVHGHWFWSGGTNFNLGQLAAAQPAPAPTPVPVTEVVPAPAPAPTPPPAAPNTVYTKLASPLNLVINKNTNKWDLGFQNDAHATSVEALAEGSSFVAYGKAQRTDGDKPCYYMTEGDFGNADQDGTPNHNVGVNTVDLSPAPAPSTATPTSSAITSTATITLPTPGTTVAPTSDDGSVKVDVKVNPSDPNSWKQSYQAFLNPQDYVANEDITVLEIDEHIPVSESHPAQQQLLKGQPIKIAGTFSRDGVKYYRTERSVVSGYWYGIPVTALRKANEPTNQETEFDKILSDLENDVEPVLSKAIALEKMASANGLVKRVFKRNK